MATPSSFRELRPGERLPTFATALAIAFVLVAYYLLKPARDSLFLAYASPERLPWVYILAALVAAPVATLHAALGRGRSLGPMAVGTLLTLAATLPGLHFLVGLNSAWAPYLLYSWAGIVGALATSQLWLMAGVLFDASQAKRVFPLLSVGAIIGAVAGGETTRLLIERIGFSAADLLYAAAAALLVAAVLVAWIWSRWGGRDTSGPSRSGARAHTSSLRTVKLVLRSRHLTLVVGLLAMAVVVTTFVDYQFKTIAWRAYPDAGQLASFLGRFYGLVSLASLLVQMLFSGRVMSRFGVGGLVAALPIVLAFGSGALLVAPGLLAATMLRGSDLGLKHSLDRTGRELLLLPVSVELKRRTKLFIDVFVDRWFRGIAGGLLLLATSVLGLSVRALAVPVLLMVAGWIVLVVLMRREYAQTFRSALARRQIDPTAIRRHLDDDDTVRAVSAALNSGVERRILYALTLAPAVKGLDHAADLAPLLDHDSGRVRAAALTALGEMGDNHHGERAQALIGDESPAVGRAACGYLAWQAGDDRHHFFRGCLEHGSSPERNAAAGWIADHGDARDVALVSGEDLERIFASSGPDDSESRRTAVRLLGRSTAETVPDRLELLLDDPDPCVARDAVAELAARDDRRSRELVLARFGDRRLRTAAREALVKVGPAIVPDLAAALHGDEFLARQQAVRALGAVGGREAAEALLDLVEDSEPVIRETTLTALARMRRADPRIKLPPARLTELHKRRLALYHGLTQARRVLMRDGCESCATGLLKRTLEEKIARTVLDVFMLLGLRYRPEDIRSAWFGIRSGDRHRKASVAEFLEQILDEPERSLMRPLTGDGTDAELQAAGRRDFGLDLSSESAALEYLIGLDDPWLRACAVYHAGTHGDGSLRRLAVDRLNDASPLVREAASLAKAG